MAGAAYGVVLVALFLVTGCGGANSAANTADTRGPVPAQTITVLAAASMTNLINEAAVTFGKQTGHTVKASFGGSDVLANQVMQGSDADIFVSASADWMKKVEDAGLVDGASAVLAGNTLVCVVPKDAEKPADAVVLKVDRYKVLAIAGETVPAGKYARQALEKLGLSAELSPRFVGQKDVRAVLRAVAAGESEAGFVYRTDALVEPKVAVAFEFDARLHARIVYPAAVLKEGKAKAAATQFLAWLRSAQGLKLLAKHGFAPGD